MMAGSAEQTTRTAVTIETVDGTVLQSATAVATALDSAGAVVVRRAFSSDWLARVIARCERGQAGAGQESIDGPLAEPELLGHPELAPVLALVLGEAYIIGRVSVGAAADDTLLRLPTGSVLFGDANADTRIPAIGLSLYVAWSARALQLFCRSHRNRASTDRRSVSLAAGDCLLSDTRLSASSSDRGSALLVVYFRHWFREPIAPMDAPPVSISPMAYQLLPSTQRHLLSWRIDRYFRLRPKIFFDRSLHRLPAPVVDVVRRLLSKKLP